MEKKTDKDAEVAVDTTAPPPPAYTTDEGFIHEGTVEGQAQLGFWTRMGCTPESFKRRKAVDKYNQLNMTLRSRHLHMIAIGGSIGAGFFVGSGGALNRGGPASLLICFSIVGFVSFHIFLLVERTD
jgi:amino acid transporter